MIKLKLFLIAFILTSCHSCVNKTPFKSQNIHQAFQSLTHDTTLIGSILIYDLKSNSYYSNDFNWAKTGHIPASTFKIPHSLIAIELGLIENENTVLKWNGNKRDFKIWQQDLTAKQAFDYSCVPCYQKIAQKVGEKRMNKFIYTFSYGVMVINQKNIDEFWLVGNSKISQFEQIDFLKNLYLSKLPISKKTEQVFKQLFIVKQDDDYTLRAKTGLSITNESYNGWYVGYLEKQDNVYFFATNISPKDKYQKSFNKKRKNITINALKQLNILPQ